MKGKGRIKAVGENKQITYNRDARRLTVLCAMPSRPGIVYAMYRKKGKKTKQGREKDKRKVVVTGRESLTIHLLRGAFHQ